MQADFSITLNAISLTRGSTPIIEGLSLCIMPSDLIWIGGDNGIGKSSLLKLISGLLRPDNGQIDCIHGGQDVRPGDLISYQGHRDAHKPYETVSETLRFWASLRPALTNIDAAIDAAVDAVGIRSLCDQSCSSLSAGQSRRVALAKLIIDAKPVWVMDEPSAAMDAAGQVLIERLITDHIASGGAAIIASHAPPKRLAGQAKFVTLSRANQGEAA